MFTNLKKFTLQRVLSILIILFLLLLAGYLLSPLVVPVAFGATAEKIASPTPSPTPTFPIADTSPTPQGMPGKPQPTIEKPGEGAKQGNQQSPDAGAVIDILTIPANGTPVLSTAALTQGSPYTIRITGMYQWGGCDPINCPGAEPTYLRWGDAAFLTDDNWLGLSDPSWSNSTYLAVNGSRPNFGAYNSQHLYRLQTLGNGLRATFSIEDCGGCYGDNAGSLRAEIIEGPDTDGATALAVLPFQQSSMIDAGLANPNHIGDWGADPYGAGGGGTIGVWGCFLTSWAMSLDYWASANGVVNLPGQPFEGQPFHTNPRELNNWLLQNDGYSGLNVRAPKVAEFARRRTGRPYMILGAENRNIGSDDMLHQLLTTGTPKPVILEVANSGHYVLGVGETESQGNRTWYINDPIRTSKFDLFPTLQRGYGNVYTWMEWGGEVDGPASVASLSIMLASPAELLVTDPQGRRSGFDPRSQTEYNEIPNASYHTSSIEADDGQSGFSHPIKEFYWPLPSVGGYTVEVIGTGAGPYTLSVLGYDDDGEPASTVVTGEIQEGALDSYMMSYSSAPGSQIVIERQIVTPTPTVTGTPPTATPTKTATLTHTATLTPTPTPTACGGNALYDITPMPDAAIVPGSDDSGNHCDDCRTLITLPFPFTLYDSSYTSAYVGSNGNMGFVASDDNFANACLPDFSASYAIFPYWDDLRTDVGTGAGIYTSVSGTSPDRIFNIEWRATYYPGDGTANFEVRLYEGTGQFDLVYGTLTNGIAGATGGAQKDQGSVFQQLFCNSLGTLATGGFHYTQPPCDTPTATSTSTSTATNTPSATSTATSTSTSTATNTATATNTPSPTPINSGALTIGFWKNNSNRYVTRTTYQALRNWLRTFNPYRDLSNNAALDVVNTYINNIMSNATAGGQTLNPMLKAQMLATALDVYFSDPTRLSGTGVTPINTNGNGPIGNLDIDLTKICTIIDGPGGSACNGIYRPAGPAFNNQAHMTVSAMLAYAASRSDATNGLINWYNQVRSIQILAKDAFDAINNSVAFRYVP